MSALNVILADAGYSIDNKNRSLNDQFKLILSSKQTENISTLFETIYIEAENVSRSISQNPVMIGETLVAVSLGLSSHDSTVCLWTCRILSRLAYHLHNMVEKGLWRGIYTSFKNKGGGIFDQCLGCLKRHPLERSVFALIEHFIQDDIPDFFLVHLGGRAEDLITNCQIIHRLFEYSERNALTRHILESHPGNVVGTLLQMLVQVHESASGDDRIAIIKFVSYLFCTYHNKNSRDASDMVLMLMKRGSQNSSLGYRAACLSCMFEILQVFVRAGEDKRALEVFRFLAMMILEYHNDPIKCFLLGNMVTLLEDNPKLPGNMIVDSLIKFLAVSVYDNHDMDFLFVLAKHETVDGYFALHLMDFLWHISTTDLYYGRSAILSLMVLINRFPELAEEVVMKNMNQAIMILRNEDDSEGKVSMILELFGCIVDLGFVNINNALITLCEKAKNDDPQRQIIKLWMYMRQSLVADGVNQPE